MIRKTYYYAYGGFQFPLLGSLKIVSSETLELVTFQFPLLGSAKVIHGMHGWRYTTFNSLCWVRCIKIMVMMASNIVLSIPFVGFKQLSDVEAVELSKIFQFPLLGSSLIQNLENRVTILFQFPLLGS